MKILIKEARIINPQSKHHNNRVDILIENNTIKTIAEVIEEDADEVVTGNDLHVSAGWFDLHAQFGDPGLEHREDLVSGAKAAAKGGFTGVLLMPSTQPVIDNKGQVEYLLKKAQGLPTQIELAGSLTTGCNGLDISEMYDMSLSGVKVFTDDKHPIDNPDVIKRALMYTKTFDGLVMVFPMESQIAHDGKMHEGVVSTKLGLKGLASLAEEIIVSRDLFLADYAESRIHFSCISSKKSVELIREAKTKGTKVTCDVSYLNLVYTDEALEGFDSNFKVNPPLRTEEDRRALIGGLKDGTIDAIVSDHIPLNIEEKDCEFDHAGFGVAGIETLYAELKTALTDELSEEELLQFITVNPRNLLGLDHPVIDEGAKANLTVFDPFEEFTQGKLVSKSQNNPAIGKKLKGMVVKTVY